MLRRSTAITAAAAASSMATTPRSTQRLGQLGHRACADSHRTGLTTPTIAHFGTSSQRQALASPPRAPSQTSRIEQAPRSAPRQHRNPHLANPRGDPTSTSPATAAFRQALQGGNLESVWEAWMNLKDAGKPRELSRRNVADMMRLAEARMMGQSDGMGSGLFGEMRSVWLAHARETWDAPFLSECLRLELACGQPETVWEVASEVTHELASRHLERNEYFRPPPAESTAHPISAELVIWALAARLQLSSDGFHEVAPLARKMRWLPPPSEVKGSQGIVSPISRSRASRILSIQGLDEGLIDAYVSRLQLAWGLDDVAQSKELEEGKARAGRNVLARKLGMLLAAGDIDAAMTYTRLAVDVARGGAEAWLSMQAGDTGDLCDVTWATLISALLGQRRSELASEVWQAYNDHILQADPQAPLRPSMRVWNALLMGHASAGDWEAVYATWRALSDQGLQPDAFAYTSMISAMFRARRPDDAMAVFQEMKARVEEQQKGGLKPGEPRLEISTEAYNAVLHGLTYNRRGVEAERLLAQMIPPGGEKATSSTSNAAAPRPTIGTINTLLRAQARRGDIDGIVSWLQRIDELGLTPDVVTFTTVLDGLLRCGCGAPDAVDRVLGIMRSSGVKVNEVTMTAIIKGLLNPSGTGRSPANANGRRLVVDAEGEAEASERSQTSDAGPCQLEAALRVLDQMERRGPSPNEVTYTSLIDAAFRRTSASLVAPLVASDESAQALGQLLPALRSDLGESEEVLSTAAQDASHRLLALALLDRMRSRGLEPNRKTYQSLLEGLMDFTGWRARNRPFRGNPAPSQPIELSEATTRMMLRRALELLEEMCASTAIPSDDRRHFKPLLSMAAGGQTRDRRDGTKIRSANRAPAPAPKAQNWATVLRGLMQCLELTHLEEEVATGSSARGGATTLDEARHALGEVVERIDRLGMARSDEALRRAQERARRLLDLAPEMKPWGP